MASDAESRGAEAGAAPRRRAVFLDRDGTLVREIDYLADPAGLELLPGVTAALRELSAAGYLLCVVTNQSGVARGLLSEETLHRIHERLEELLAREGVRLDSIGYCPHHPTAGAPPYRRACECRKPAPGLLRAAAERFDADLAASWTVGDALRDVDAGAALGVRGMLVRTGKGRAEEQRAREAGRALEVADDLGAAARRILAADPRAS